MIYSILKTGMKKKQTENADNMPDFNPTRFLQRIKLLASTGDQRTFLVCGPCCGVCRRAALGLPPSIQTYLTRRGKFLTFPRDSFEVGSWDESDRKIVPMLYQVLVLLLGSS